jgi:hypothetical protein
LVSGGKWVNFAPESIKNQTTTIMRTLAVSVVVCCLMAQLATAQMRTPQPSPGASVMQTIGVTDITVKYSRPSLKGRTPFTDALVPFGKVWRTGANAATNFTTSTDLMVNGKALAAGSYALLSIPAQDEWTLIFSKNTGVTEQTYKPDDDVLRVMLKPTTTTDKTDTFTIGFTELSDSTGTMNIIWGNAKAPVSLAVNTAALAAAGVDKAVADKPEDAAVLQQAAGYNLSKNRNLEQALSWADKSIGLKETFRNVWLKAQILAKMGKTGEALPLAQKALSLGEASNDAAFPFFKEGIQKGITDYTAMMPKVIETVKGKKRKG